MAFDVERFDARARDVFARWSAHAGFLEVFAASEARLGDAVAGYLARGWTRDEIRRHICGSAHDWAAEGRLAGLPLAPVPCGDLVSLVRAQVDQLLDEVAGGGDRGGEPHPDRLDQ